MDELSSEDSYRFQRVHHYYFSSAIQCSECTHYNMQHWVGGKKGKKEIILASETQANQIQPANLSNLAFGQFKMQNTNGNGVYLAPGLLLPLNSLGPYPSLPGNIKVDLY